MESQQVFRCIKLFFWRETSPNSSLSLAIVRELRIFRKSVEKIQVLLNVRGKTGVYAYDNISLNAF
jgi:hypothetical protein